MLWSVVLVAVFKMFCVSRIMFSKTPRHTGTKILVATLIGLRLAKHNALNITRLIVKPNLDIFISPIQCATS